MPVAFFCQSVTIVPMRSPYALVLAQICRALGRRANGLRTFPEDQFPRQSFCIRLIIRLSCSHAASRFSAKFFVSHSFRFPMSPFNVRPPVGWFRFSWPQGKIFVSSSFQIRIFSPHKFSPRAQDRAASFRIRFQSNNGPILAFLPRAEYLTRMRLC